MTNHEISIADVLASIGQPDAPTIIDIRDGDSFARGHIPGASWNGADSFDVARFPQGTAYDTPLVIACYRGVMSKEVVNYLHSMGYTDVKSMAGGMEAWRRTPNAPMETGR